MVYLIASKIQRKHKFCQILEIRGISLMRAKEVIVTIWEVVIRIFIGV